jgi:16S rRNA (cytosine967-C5)-methyltransferase
MSRSVKDARTIALKVLLLWEREKPPLDELLSQILARNPLPDERDRAFVGELVNGVVRHLLYLDFLMERFSKVPLDKLDPEVKNALRLGIYQLLFTRIPERAVLAETLRILLKRGRASWIRGFVNAILHRIAEHKLHLPEPPRAHPLYYLSIKYSFPEWLILRWFKRFGLEELERLLQASNSKPPLVIRVNPLKVSRESFLRYLQEEVLPTAEPCPYSPSGIVLKGFKGRITELKGFDLGWFSVQDSSSQLVGFLLDPRPGDLILDACAGVGGKTSHIAELTKGQAKIVAFDLHRTRLQKLKENFKRLGLVEPLVFEGDVVEGLKSQNFIAFDRILLDAPCTGTGIIRRHPDIKWARREGDLKEISQRQLDLLSGVASYLKRGGRLLYATCSLEPEENEEVLEAFLEKHPDFSLKNPQPFLRELCGEVGKTLVEGAFLKTYPHRHGLDGFFSALLTKEK